MTGTPRTSMDSILASKQSVPISIRTKHLYTTFLSTISFSHSVLFYINHNHNMYLQHPDQDAVPYIQRQFALSCA